MKNSFLLLFVLPSAGFCFSKTIISKMRVGEDEKDFLEPTTAEHPSGTLSLSTATCPLRDCPSHPKLSRRAGSPVCGIPLEKSGH